MTKKDNIIDYIKNKIEIGEYQYGDKIPSEEKLASLLNTSRGTVRVALEKLKFEGIIESKTGSGSYVSIKNTDRKYILILTQEKNVYGSSRTTYKTLLGLVEKEIENTGYIPYTYLERKNNELFKDISHILKNTVGVISIHSTEANLEIIDKENIPIITTLFATANEYSTIIVDYHDLFLKLYGLIKKYNINNPLVFSLSQKVTRKESDRHIFYATDKYFEKYNLVHISYSDNLSSTQGIFEKTMKNLKIKPDALIFLDENILNNVLNLIGNYPNLLKNIKIITQSSKLKEYDPKYKICEIAFDINETAKNGVLLLSKKINKKEINKPNVIIKPIIINEDYLK